MDIKQQFGLAVRNKRKQLGISQEELAMRVNADDTIGNEHTKYADQSYISKIELGQSNITLETIGVLADALECDVKDLFG